MHKPDNGCYKRADGRESKDSQQRLHFGGQSEDARAHDAVDHQGQQIPSAEGTQQTPVVGSIRSKRESHLIMSDLNSFSNFNVALTAQRPLQTASTVESGPVLSL